MDKTIDLLPRQARGKHKGGLKHASICFSEMDRSEPQLAEHYAPMRVAVQLDDGDHSIATNTIATYLDRRAPTRSRTRMAAAAEADASSDGVVVVALERCLLPRCWWDTADQDDHQQQEVQDQHQQEAQLQRWPSVSEAVQAQMCRSYESWRWSDTLEELIDHLQTTALPLPQSQPPPGASPTAAAAAVAGGSGGGGEEGAMEAAQAAQHRRLAQLRLLRGDIDALAEAAAEAAAEPEPEPEPEDAGDNVVELDMAAVEAAGVELLPEMSDDWMAAFRN
jgi:hypothetical protein